MPNPVLINLKNSLNRFKKLDNTPTSPWKALYIFWLGLGMRNNINIYMDNKLSKKIDTPHLYRGEKEILYRYRDDKKLWALEISKTYDYLQELECTKRKTKIETQFVYINWPRVWRHWSDIYSPQVQSIIYLYLHDSWLTGEVALRRRMTRTQVRCPLCRKAPYTREHVIVQCDETKEERTKLIKELMKIDVYDKRQLLFLDGKFNKTTIRQITDYIMKIQIKCGPLMKVRDFITTKYSFKL